MSVLPWDKQAQSFRLFSLIVYTFYTAEIGYWQGEGLTTDDEGQRIAVRPARPTVSVYSVYFVVQISASFAFFAAKTFYTFYMFYTAESFSALTSNLSVKSLDT